jgi:hypothetical protein
MAGRGLSLLFGNRIAIFLGEISYSIYLAVVRSSQRYDWRVRYVDLGLSRGFEADLVVDEAGLVLRYEHLFERVAPQPEPFT